MRELIDLLESKSQYQYVEIIDFAYSHSALSPVISPNALRYHYDKLAHGYADRYNKKTGDQNFNYAGAMLHNLYFQQFRSPRPNNKPNGPVGNLIKTRFKTWDNFKDKFEVEAMKLHGSGWIYMSRSGEIKTILNHQLKPDILILVDMWEHAFNIDYGADKERYLDKIWNIMDWGVINTRWGQGYKR